MQIIKNMIQNEHDDSFVKFYLYERIQRQI